MPNINATTTLHADGLISLTRLLEAIMKWFEGNIIEDLLGAKSAQQLQMAKP